MEDKRVTTEQILAEIGIDVEHMAQSHQSVSAREMGYREVSFVLRYRVSDGTIIGLN